MLAVKNYQTILTSSSLLVKEFNYLSVLELFQRQSANENNPGSKYLFRKDYHFRTEEF